MKLYFASTAPGTDTRIRFITLIRKRLLSYCHVKGNNFWCGDIFNLIKSHNKECRSEEKSTKKI